MLPTSTVNLGSDTQQIEFTHRVGLLLPYPEYREKEGESIPEEESIFDQPCLHHWSADFRTEFQSPVRSKKVIMTPENIQLLLQVIFKSGKACSSPGQV